MFIINQWYDTQVRCLNPKHILNSFQTQFAAKQYWMVISISFMDSTCG